MKTFMKTCGILALVLLGAGIVLTICGLTLGGPREIARSVEQVTNGNLSLDLDTSDGNYGITFGNYSVGDLKELLGSVFDSNVYEVNDFETVYDDNEKVLSGTIDRWQIEGEDIKKLKADIGGYHFIMLPSEDDHFWISAKEVNKMQAYTKGDALYLKATRKGTLSSNAIWNSVITLYVPAEYRFEKMELEMGAGVLNADALNAEKIALKIGAGEVTIEKCISDELQVDVGAGAFSINDMFLKKLNCEVGMGDIALNGSLLGDAKMECAMGNISMMLSNDEKDFNYKLEAAMGNIDLGEQSYSGLAKEKEIDNGASRTLKLQCSMGNISVNFSDLNVE